jgi:hypothetical protein
MSSIQLTKNLLVEVDPFPLVCKAEAGLAVVSLEHMEPGGGDQVPHLQVQLLLPHLHYRQD